MTDRPTRQDTDLADDQDDDEGSATWRVFVTLVTATALFFACFAFLYDASVWWGPRPPSLGPPSSAPK